MLFIADYTTTQRQVSAVSKLLFAGKADIGKWDFCEKREIWESDWERHKLGKGNNHKEKTVLKLEVPVIPVFFCQEGKKEILKNFAYSITKFSVRENEKQKSWH